MKNSKRYWNEESETMPLEKLASRQMEKLKHYIDYAYNNSAHYRRVMDNKKLKPSDIRTLEDYYTEIPFIDKSTLIEEQLNNPPFGNFLTVD